MGNLVGKGRKKKRVAHIKTEATRLMNTSYRTEILTPPVPAPSANVPASATDWIA